MAPKITGVMNGLNIWKHQAIKRVRTPIRIAMSIAISMYDFSWVILAGWFKMVPLLALLCQISLMIQLLNSLFKKAFIDALHVCQLCQSLQNPSKVFLMG